MSRREKLIKASTNPSDNPKTSGQKFISLAQLGNMKVRIPSQVAETGMMVYGRILTDGRIEVGMTDKPIVFRPISDLTKIARARSLVTNEEAAAAKASTIENVKNFSAAALIKAKKQESVQVKPGAQVELLNLSVRRERLEEHLKMLSVAPKDSTSSTLATWLENSIRVITEYAIDNLLTSEVEEKLPEMLLNAGVPSWAFQKFSTQKYPELQNKFASEILFPKKMEKGLAYSWNELLSEEFINVQGAFTGPATLLRRAGQLLSTPKDSTAKVYVPPFNFYTRVSSVESFPKLGSKTELVTGLSIVIMRALCANIEPERLSERTLSHYLDCVVQDGPQFRMDDKDPRDMKAQFLELWKTIQKKDLNAIIPIGELLQTFSLDFLGKQTGYWQANLVRLPLFPVVSDAIRDVVAEIAADIVVDMDQTTTKKGKSEPDTTALSRNELKEKLKKEMVPKQKEPQTTTTTTTTSSTGKSPQAEKKSPKPKKDKGKKKSRRIEIEIDNDEFVIVPTTKYNFDMFTLPFNTNDAVFKKTIALLARLRPTSPKELKFPVSSALNRSARQLIADLKATAQQGRLDPVFVKNIESFLRSFDTDSFMELAVRLIRAGLEDKFAIEPDDPEGSDQEADAASDDEEPTGTPLDL